jgi:hypothetical protein
MRKATRTWACRCLEARLRWRAKAWDKLVQAGSTKMLGTGMTGQVVGFCLACCFLVFVKTVEQEEDEM